MCIYQTIQVLLGHHSSWIFFFLQWRVEIDCLDGQLVNEWCITSSTICAFLDIDIFVAFIINAVDDIVIPNITN